MRSRAGSYSTCPVASPRRVAPPRYSHSNNGDGIKFKPLHWTGWLLRVLTWDGLVPVSMLLLSRGLTLIVVGGGGEFDLLSIILPCIAIGVRLYLGHVAISVNHCTPSVRQAQFISLLLGLILLAVIECALILAATLPPGNGPFDRAEDRQIGYWLLAAYISFVTIAMYPGREPILPGEDEHFAPDLDEG